MLPQVLQVPVLVLFARVVYFLMCELEVGTDLSRAWNKHCQEIRILLPFCRPDFSSSGLFALSSSNRGFRRCPFREGKARACILEGCGILCGISGGPSRAPDELRFDCKIGKERLDCGTCQFQYILSPRLGFLIPPLRHNLLF
jgi:hypothetical protein